MAYGGTPTDFGEPAMSFGADLPEWCVPEMAKGVLALRRSHFGGNLVLAESCGALPNPGTDLVETTQDLIVRLLHKALELVIRHENGLGLFTTSHDVGDVVFGNLVEEGTETLPQV